MINKAMEVAFIKSILQVTFAK